MTSERRTSSAAPAEERRFKRLVESFAQAVWEADSTGSHIASSGTWPMLTGQSAPSCEGSGWLDAVHPDDRAGVKSAWDRSVESGCVYQREYRVQRDDGAWVWTLAHAAPIFDEQGNTLKWVGMNVDISARKNAQTALLEADHQKDVFISILAHELRNPLAPLRSGLDLLLSETATSAAKARAVALMGRQTVHLARLVEDLIDASRITNGKLQVHLENVRLGGVLRGAVASIEPAASAKRQRIVIDGLDDVDPLLNADPVRLNQAFVNVFNNSTKFSPERSTIGIRVVRHEDRVSVIACDTGRGISESDLPNIFKLFVQSARHDRGDGLGIGLALASDVVKLHGGTIEARSGQGGIGAEFEISLPVITYETADSRADEPTLTNSAKSLRILVVDDNTDAAEVLGALLELAGHTIRIVHDGSEAITEAADFLPEVIFMDVGMPVMGGMEATRHIRALNLSVRPYIVTLTGWSSEADKRASREAGSDLHLSKPAEYATILDAIQRGTR